MNYYKIKFTLWSEFGLRYGTVPPPRTWEQLIREGAGLQSKNYFYNYTPPPLVVKKYNLQPFLLWTPPLEVTGRDKRNRMWRKKTSPRKWQWKKNWYSKYHCRPLQTGLQTPARPPPDRCRSPAAISLLVSKLHAKLLLRNHQIQQ